MNHVSTRQVMQHITSVLFALLLPLSAAMAAETLTEKDLNREFSHLRTVKKLSANFEQIRLVKSWGAEIKTTGRLTMDNNPNANVLWEVLTPTYSAMKMGTTGTFFKSTQDPLASWLPLTNPKTQQQLECLFSWIRFDSKKLARDFHLQRKSRDHLVLKPKNAKSQFQRIEIRFDKNRLVSDVQMIEPNTDSIALHFSDTEIVR